MSRTVWVALIALVVGCTCLGVKGRGVSKKNYVIIGTSAAGVAAAMRLCELDEKANIVCVSDEKELPHNKCFIADVLARELDYERLFTLSQKKADELNISLLLGVRATRIDPQAHSITLSTGKTLNYDKLLLATGTRAYTPAIQGIQSNGVFTFHNLNDLHKIEQYAAQKHVKRAVVLGAGINGLEVADALRESGVHVAIVDHGERVMARQIDVQGAELLGKYIAGTGTG